MKYRIRFNRSPQCSPDIDEIYCNVDQLANTVETLTNEGRLIININLERRTGS